MNKQGLLCQAEPNTHPGDTRTDKLGLWPWKDRWTLKPGTQGQEGTHSRLREVAGDEVGTLEQEEDVAEGLALERTIHGYPVGVLREEAEGAQPALAGGQNVDTQGTPAAT